MMSGPMKALLGVLAVVGYQNRDKIAEILRGVQNPQAGSNRETAQAGSAQSTGGLGGIFGGPGGFGDLLGGLTTGGILSGGLADLLRTFQQNGHGETAQTWVQPGPNAAINGDQLSQALGPDILNELSAKTGLSRQDILERLSRDLPKAVDDLTPDGKIPDPREDFLDSASTATTDGQKSV
ncbi:uncharacterized protein YidB (DUF937 family) [Rhizobium sp. BK529]|uniref:YidB family protein n=1 Tax=Rhizobium sp. BK529 TaxID=2586983 RepID=UPI0016072E75|nr:YidB family protein [Rhizobium sp. BK529]MBB3595930.1 uncharacterized protein YidB (DUF937 family) [Rhizobium sp. BK529]